MKIFTYLTHHKLLLAILLLGLFMRTYRPLELFMYSHDQDLLAWFVKDIVMNHNLRLIGQETSVHGVFIGPLFYYAMVPFFMLWGMSPIGGIALITIIGVLTVFSTYFVFRSIWGERVGIVGSLIYASSYYTTLVDREVVPTTPVILWSIWFLYAISQIAKGNQKRGFLITGILLGLIWHFNLALILMSPLILLVQYHSKKKIELKNLILPVVIFLGLMSPFFIFELRHNFSQTRAIISQLHSSAPVSETLGHKVNHVIELFEKNLGSVWGTSLVNIPRRPILYLLPVLILLLGVVKKITKREVVTYSLWLVLFLVFFTINSLNLSEYYLNGTVVVFVLLLALFIDYLLSQKRLYFIGLILLVLYVSINIHSFLNISINRSGYVERSAAVSEIKRDAGVHNYPCVAVSYITSPGSNLGYRYLFYMQGVKTAPIPDLAPVYTIVYPLNLVDKVDLVYGAVGVIYPDYKKYTPESVAKSCSGSDWNLSEPLFGYVD